LPLPEAAGSGDPKAPLDARVVEVLPPDPSTIDLTEAHRIVGGGAGLDDAERFGQLIAFAEAIGASMGATRVITDRSWVPHDKQIGTTGVVVDPDLYVAFGISGAVQHTAGLGDPDHIISVNTDPHCPMMQMSDLAIVSDANETLAQLHAALFDAVSEDATAERSDR
jgi:electron transfer flavoprotein alpha subunit